MNDYPRPMGAVPLTSAREAIREAASIGLDGSPGDPLAQQALDIITALEKKAEAYDRINTPELFDFVKAVENEALHQRERWGTEKDGGKTDADWFWLIGYLAGKALHNPAKSDMEPVSTRLHRIVTIAAAAANWHAATMGVYAAMRPGIETPPEAERV